MTSSHSVDADRLYSDLRRTVRGEVRFDAGSRAMYATDGSNYRQVPIGVVIPKDADDVVAAVAVCRTHGAPVLGRGGGTSLAGQCCNVAVVFDMSKYMNRVLEIDAARKIARVQPGVILDDLRHAAEKMNLTFGPDPATHSHCTLGGMIGNDSCGVHSVMSQFYGPGPRTSHQVESLDILTYDGVRMTVGRTSDQERRAIVRDGGRRGEIYSQLEALSDRYAERIRERFPDIPRLVSGYNLQSLLPENGFQVAQALVGSEGTCVLILEAAVKLIDNPPARALLVLGYPSVFEAADHVPQIMRHRPIGLEGMDDRLVKDLETVGYASQTLSVLPDGAGWLLVEFGGETREAADARANALMAELKRLGSAPTMKLFDDPHEEERVWKVRESGLGATAHVSSEHPTWEGWEDSAVPPERFGEYLRKLRTLLDTHHYIGDFYGHFGQGCLHTRIDFDLETAAGIKRYRSFIEEAADLVVSLGGSLSGEHGDGQSRGELLPKMFGTELVQAFREFKAIWDPAGRMNPGKVVNPYRLDENLRLGTGYQPPQPPTHFKFPQEGGSFAKAALRCVGVGECRRIENGTMCPSFMVTREEMHSTRGRARLLFEMLQGDPLKDGWEDEHIKEALDLCLACKGCKSDCPVNVDMATYKAEFLSHYHERHRRPVTAYSLGLIQWWARAASLAPRFVNLITQTRGLAEISKIAAGMPLERKIPAFAPETFQQWFHRQAPIGPPHQPRVILWPDTFNNYFHPETAIAAVAVLRAAGLHVQVPLQPLCCGRPLYDYGMLDRAKRTIAHVMRAMAGEIRDGVPIVGLEPSCVAVFRDELGNLFPNDEQARRLGQQTFTLSEFLEQKAPSFTPPPLRRHAIVHGHCHHRAIMKLDAELSVLRKMALDFELLDSGCCGMAGSFGFERDHYEISMKVGERVLLPAVRRLPKDALIIADGFSCREQIVQATGRRALHLAEVLQMALGT